MVQFVVPRVIKLAETKVDQRGVEIMMKEYGKVAEDWLFGRQGRWSSSGEMLIEIAGRACYRSFGTGLNPNITQIRSESKEYFENILKRGDGSILEHASVTFALMWVSRVFTHQLVRHRAGTAFSQESLRYLRLKELHIPAWSGWLPTEISDEARDNVLNALKEVETMYHKVEAKIPWDEMSFDEKKRVTSAIRRILPEGVATVIVFTANHRTVRWLIEMRTDSSAEIEIRRVFGEIAEACIRDFPLIYGDFKKAELSDGTFEYKPQLRSKA